MPSGRGCQVCGVRRRSEARTVKRSLSSSGLPSVLHPALGTLPSPSLPSSQSLLSLSERQTFHSYQPTTAHRSIGIGKGAIERTIQKLVFPKVLPHCTLASRPRQSPVCIAGKVRYFYSFFLTFISCVLSLTLLSPHSPPSLSSYSSFKASRTTYKPELSPVHPCSCLYYKSTLLIKICPCHR